METTQINNLERVADRFRSERKINPQLLHQTKLLLTLYRQVVWSVERDLYEIDVTANDFGSRRIQDLVNYLSFDFEDDINKNAIEDRLKSLADTRDLIIVIDKALCRLKTYPLHGELYFDIINRKYIIMYQYSDQELMASLNLERTTFYKRKKEAINLLGTILWGYILPEMIDATWGTYLVCADSPSEPNANFK